ncbi:MAG: hypothetical protein WAU37_06635 [Formosimonas sp.]
MEFKPEQIKQRRIRRLAQIILDHFEEGSGMDTRYFDHPFINDEHVIDGQSIDGGDYREHVVPRVYLRDQCMEMYKNGATVESVTEVLLGNLRIVKIKPEQAVLLNKQYRDTMPAGWIIGKNDPLERLYSVGIQIA